MTHTVSAMRYDWGMADDVWVQLRAFNEPSAARMALDFLQHHGIAVSVRGDSPEGVRNLYSPFDIRIMVRPDALEEARSVLEAMDGEASAATPFRGPLASSESSETLADDEPASTLRRKNGAFAFVLAFLVPIGGGHFYAQHTLVGWVFALAMGACFIGIVATGSGLAAMAWLSLLAADALLAPWAARRWNGRRVPGRAGQAALGLGAVALSLVAAAGYWNWTVLHPERAAREAQEARLRRCTDGSGSACFELFLQREREAHDRSSRFGLSAGPDEVGARLLQRACELGEARACERRRSDESTAPGLLETTPDP